MGLKLVRSWEHLRSTYQSWGWKICHSLPPPPTSTTHNLLRLCKDFKDPLCSANGDWAAWQPRAECCPAVRVKRRQSVLSIILLEAFCVGLCVLFLPTRTSQKFLDPEGLSLTPRKSSFRDSPRTLGLLTYCHLG